MSQPHALEALTRSLAGDPQPRGADAGRRYLHPGQLVAAADPLTVTTILGSCVGVCLYDPVRRVGGVNHFLLPEWPGDGERSTRFGDVAMAELLSRVLALGARRADLLARVYGGACVVDAFRGDAYHLGERNAALALVFLRREDIPVLDADTGGRRGRKLVFHTTIGSSLITRI